MRYVRHAFLAFLTALMLATVSPAPPAAQAAGEPVLLAANDPLGTGKPVKESSVFDYVNRIFQYLAVIGGLLAILMIMVAGYAYMTSYGDPEKLSTAKDIIEKTLIGLALLIFAAVILNAVNDRTSGNVCQKNDPGCGPIDFTKPKG